MDRYEKVGLGIAIAGHVVLFGLLSVGFLATPDADKLKQQPVEVSLVKEVALEASAPQAVAPPAQSVAPDQGEPEDAAPPAETVAAPEPDPAPPEPAPAKPQPAKPAPATKPVPAPKPVPRPVPVKPTPAPAKAAPAKQAAAAPTRSAAYPTRAAPSVAKGSGGKPESTLARPRGSRLGADFLAGLTDKPSPSKSTAPVAAKLDSRALASIVQAIARQIQPCADRQVTTGMPGASSIVTVLNLRLNEDGTLAATPRMVRQTGVNDDNDRYAQRAADLGVAALKACSPLRLPAEYYHTPAGGWDNINYQWQLR